MLWYWIRLRVWCCFYTRVKDNIYFSQLTGFFLNVIVCFFVIRQQRKHSKLQVNIPHWVLSCSLHETPCCSTLSGQEEKVHLGWLPVRTEWNRMLLNDFSCLSLKWSFYCEVILSNLFEEGGGGDGFNWFEENTPDWKAVVANVDDADPTIPNYFSTCWLKKRATMVNAWHM